MLLPVPSVRRAFSLVETMIAATVIASVVALLIPAVQAARHAAVRAQCANNLHNLGLAFRQWKEVNDPKTFPTTSWVSELSRYAEDCRSLFHCPLDDMSVARVDTSFSLAVYIFDRSTPLRVPEYNGSNIVPVVKSGPRVRQSSRYSLPASSPPGSWIAEFELTWNTNNYNNANDWDDLFLLMEPQTNGTLKVTFMASDTVGWVGGNEMFDVLDQNLNVISCNMKLGVSCYVPSNGRGISYGINGRAHNLELDNSKILLLEYADTVARVVNPAPYNADLSLYLKNVAARHVGVLNVLYADGHLEARVPEDIDPRDSSFAPISWAP